MIPLSRTPSARTVRPLTFLVGALALLAGSLAHAAIVTTPAGVVNGPFTDTPAFDVWQRIDIRATASVGITGDYPRSGNGSVLMTSGDGAGKTTWQYFPTGGLGPLSSFISATFDWYRDSVSTTGVNFSPVFRIRVDNDGNPLTVNDQSWLVYEPAAWGFGPAPTDTWVTANITATTFMWVWQAGAANSQIPMFNMGQFAAGAYVPEPGGFPIPATATILGVQVGTGSGWAGTFRGAIDNVGLTAASMLGSDNFELNAPLAPVSVPATDLWTLLGLAGLLSGLAARRLRRRQD